MKKILLSCLACVILAAAALPGYAEDSGSNPRTPTAKKSTASKKSSTSKKDATAKKPSRKSGSRKKGEPEEPVDTRTFEEREADRLKHFHETGIWLWPELGDEQLAAQETAQKEYLERVKTEFAPLNMVYYESAHFYYLTDAPQLIAQESLKYLELMHEKLCEMFSFPKGHPVWKGKCIVVAFVHREHFFLFESRFFRPVPPGSSISGLAHYTSEGDVLISTFYGDISTMEARWKFLGILVHETTHGFVHRYRCRAELPVWLNEGMAEFMVVAIVPADKQVGYKQRQGLQTMRQTGSVGGMMTTSGHLEVWQYGVASGMVMFLFKQNPKDFKVFVDKIKDGTDWQTAMKETYDVTPEQFLILFGRSNRIPNLLM